MELFDKLGKKASEAYKVTADKTGKIAKEAKLKMKMGELKSEINEIYEDIGKIVYEKHIREEEYDIAEELKERCTKIDYLSDEMDAYLKDCLELKDKKQCPNCYTKIEKDANFCSECGARQEKEVEQVEEVKQPEKEVDNDIDNKEESNLEKTVEVESDVKSDENETVEHLETEE